MQHVGRRGLRRNDRPPPPSCRAAFVPLSELPRVQERPVVLHALVARHPVHDAAARGHDAGGVALEAADALGAFDHHRRTTVDAEGWTTKPLLSKGHEEYFALNRVTDQDMLQK